jgi:flagellar motor switch protein FliM
VLLGGRRGTAAMRIEGRPYTTIERNLVERMVEVVLHDCRRRVRAADPVTFRFDRLETNPRFAAIARPANAAILASCASTWKIAAGASSCCCPMRRWSRSARCCCSMFMGEKFGRDSIWETQSELWHTDVSVEAVLEETSSTLREVLNWEVGTRIMLNATPTSMLSVRSGGVAMFHGKMGQRNGYIAIKLENRIQKE